jgi:tetratricopeptide (TPR) repeat protein
MGVIPLRHDDVLFASDLPPVVNTILQEAVALYHDTLGAEEKLWSAYDLAPERLEVYVALYKFYFYKGRMADAEKVVHMALEKAAQLDGFDVDWRKLNKQNALWQPAVGPTRFYLYSLKALAFIRLRRNDPTEARTILDKLMELDPNDQVGGSVILDLALGSGETGHS